MRDLNPSNTSLTGSDDLAHAALRGVSWTTAGAVLQGFVQMAVLVVLARVLTPQDFGQMSVALAVIGFVSIFSQFGISYALVQRLELTERHLQTGFTVVLVFALVLAGAVVLAAPMVALLFEIPLVASLLRWLAVGLVLDSLASIALALLQRTFRFRALAVIQLTAYLLGMGAVSIVMAFYGFGVWALLGGYVAQSALRMGIALAYLPHLLRLRLDWQALRDLTFFGGGMTAERIGVYLASYGDTLIIGHALGASLLGLYDRAYRLITLPGTFFGMAVEKVMFAATAQLQHEKDRLASAFRRSLSLAALGLLPASAACCILAPEIIAVVLGAQWMEAVPVFRILVLAMFFHTGTRISETVACAQGAVYHLAWRHWAYAALVLVGAGVGRLYGIEGVAVAVLGAVVVHFGLIADLAVRQTQLSWRALLQAQAPAAALAAGTGVVTWGSAASLRLLEASPAVTLGGTVLLVLVLCIGAVRFVPTVFRGEEGGWWLRFFAAALSGKHLRTSAHEAD